MRKERVLRLDGAQGNTEKRSIPYQEYGARVSQAVTRRSAKRVGRVSGSARKKDGPKEKPFEQFDIDGTLIRWQLYHAIADALNKFGYIDAETFLKVKNARMNWKERVHSEAFKDYEHELIDTIDQLMTELTFRQYDKAINNVFDEYKDQAYTYSRGLINSLKKDGYILLAISGSQQEIVEKIAKHCGFDDWIGSEYIRVDDGFSGKKIVRSADKRTVLENLIQKHKLSRTRSVGVGDTATDIPMLEMVETPIAFNPEINLFNHAQSKGWKIVIERKNVVIELKAKNGQYILV